MLPPLSKRLAAAVSFVRRGNSAADIGCDHGHTAIYLRNAGISPFCICTDINKGPLLAAEENIKRFNASGIVTRLCDGLSGIEPGETGTVIITGMGGTLVRRILENGKDVVYAAEELVLGPQSEPEKVRSKIYELGFFIADEEMVFEEGKYYPLIRALRWADAEPLCETAVSGGPGTPCEAELKYGPVLLREKSEILREFLLKEKKRYEEVLAHLNASGACGSEIKARKAELEYELGLTGEALEYYK